MKAATNTVTVRADGAFEWKVGVTVVVFCVVKAATNTITVRADGAFEWKVGVTVGDSFCAVVSVLCSVLCSMCHVSEASVVTDLSLLAR